MTSVIQVFKPLTRQHPIVRYIDTQLFLHKSVKFNISEEINVCCITKIDGELVSVRISDITLYFLKYYTLFHSHESNLPDKHKKIIEHICKTRIQYLDFVQIFSMDISQMNSGDCARYDYIAREFENMRRNFQVYDQEPLVKLLGESKYVICTNYDNILFDCKFLTYLNELFSIGRLTEYSPVYDVIFKADYNSFKVIPI